MKNIDDQLANILKRVEKRKKREEQGRRILAEAAVSVLLAAADIFFVIRVRSQSGQNAPETGRAYGSLLVMNEWAGLVIVAICAILLGIFVTLLCYHLKMYFSEK